MSNLQRDLYYYCTRLIIWLRMSDEHRPDLYSRTFDIQTIELLQHKIFNSFTG